MRLKRFVLSGSAGVFVVLLACVMSARGGSVISSTPFIALSGVSVPEIPAKAAALVGAAAAGDRGQTAQETVRAAATVARFGALPFVVSAICHGSPEVAGTVVATAIDAQPGFVLVFVEAAVCAAPGQMEQIVSSACQAAPASTVNVAVVAYRKFPSAKAAIKAGLVSAYPGLSPYLEAAQIEIGTNNFEAVVFRAVQSLQDDYRAQTR
jgi:hypothetical protein